PPSRCPMDLEVRSSQTRAVRERLQRRIFALIPWLNNTLAPASARCFGNRKRRSSARTPKTQARNGAPRGRPRFGVRRCPAAFTQIGNTKSSEVYREAVLKLRRPLANPPGHLIYSDPLSKSAEVGHRRRRSGRNRELAGKRWCDPTLA